MLICASPKAAKALIDALGATKERSDGSDTPDHDMRVKAGIALLDRLYGKPTQAITTEEGTSVRVDGDVLLLLQKLATVMKPASETPTVTSATMTPNGTLMATVK